MHALTPIPALAPTNQNGVRLWRWITLVATSLFLSLATWWFSSLQQRIEMAGTYAATAATEIASLKTQASENQQWRIEVLRRLESIDAAVRQLSMRRGGER